MAADGTQPVPDWTQAEAEFWAPQRNAVDASFAMQPAVYADEDYFAAEQERLFGRAWVAVALAEQVAQPGRLLVRSVGGRSVLLTRSDAGLGGFLNSCRHRGTELAERDCDIANTIRCPYHRWHYSADGRLVAAPLFDEVPRDDFDMADYGLIRVRTETWGPLVFVCLNDDTPPLMEWLGDLPERLAAYGFSEWRSTGLDGSARTFDVAANWKLIVENFAEYYHLPWVHPELAKVSRVPDHYRYQGPGMYCGQTTTPISGDERDDWLTLPAAAGLDASDAASGRFVALFPNVTLAVLPSHMFLMVLQPLAAGRTLEHCTFLFPPGPMTASEPSAELRESFKITRRFWIEVNDEDIDICERAQRGISLGGAPPGPLAPRFEEPLNRFHKMIADLMTLPSAADLTVPAGDRPGGIDLYGSEPNPLPPAVELDPVTR
ncbi:aromatic ring-hydroxylating oxygenase subunit alpha [Candidatus Poriferisodalis sp.]|uniref:aromatic ring-hydroxylating oxygenase subunit alpha n=1 Tax=Candidatus Poriferisodalis sp. TaxID=3101277 RepID=UPI003B5A422F